MANMGAHRYSSHVSDERAALAMRWKSCSFAYIANNLMRNMKSSLRRVSQESTAAQAS